jgi:hypothetical protein
MGLKDKNLDEADYKKNTSYIILLSRPVFVITIKYTLGIHSNMLQVMKALG